MGSGTDLKHGWPRDAMIVLISLMTMTFLLRLALGQKQKQLSASKR